MAAYSPARIEPKWQSAGRLKIFNSKIDLKSQNIMFWKCSRIRQKTHMGHVRNYTMGDLVAIQTKHRF